MAMHEHPKAIGRRSFMTGLVGAAAATAIAGVGVGEAKAADDRYADPKNPSLPKQDMKLDPKRAALVVIDPQIDFLSPKGGAWSILGESVTEQKTVQNLARLLESSKRAKITVAVSPHFYYPYEHTWKFEGVFDHIQHKLGVLYRCVPLTL